MADESSNQPYSSPVKRLEIKRYGYNLSFILPQDESQCLCTYEPTNSGGSPLTSSELQTHLEQFKITVGIFPEAMAQLLIAAASGEALKELLFASGVPMLPGEDGKINIMVTDALDDSKPENDESEKTDVESKVSEAVDLKHVQSFLNVEPGDLIAAIEPPGTGLPGKTVTGKVIPPQAGIPAIATIGQNVRLSDDGKQLFAEATGRVFQKDGTISVEDVYEVEGDVGFKVGNINFKGFVVIKGDVQDGFTVKATKGIKVTGNIGVCTIESDGDISFCGMNGQEKGNIICGGSLFANFIYEASVECVGNLLIDTEIRSCHIKTLGAITVKKGCITGGEYFALSGVECATLGSVSSLHTRLVVGVHYKDTEELNYLFNELKTLMAEFTAKKETSDIKLLTARRALITEKTHEVRLRIHEESNPKINVTQKLYEGVSITLGMITETTKEERKGPMSIIENTIEGGLRFLGMTQLAFKAMDIEQTFIQQHEMEKQKIMNVQEV